MTPVTVIGAGLAGCECAWQLAGRGIPVRLIEMKPKKMTPAHVSENFAELVCSNSLRSDELTNAVGLLKEELRRLDSVVLASADHNRVAAGGALAVDREAFAREITERICAHPNITVERAEADAIPDGEVIIATGPLTSDDSWGSHMVYTSRALEALSRIGGPRCCKRDAYVSLETAVDYIRERFGVRLEKDDVRCEFHARNAQCLGERCPFFPTSRA